MTNSMKVIRKNLLAAIARVAPVANPKSPSPLLAHVLVTPTSRGAELACTNLEMSARSVVGCGEGALSDAFSCDARSLLDVVKAMSGESVDMSIAEHNLLLTCGRSRIELPTMPGDEYPRRPEAPADGFHEVDSADFARLLSMVQSAQSQDDTRPHLCGVNVVADAGRLSCCATDGHRAARAAIASDCGTWTALMPSRAVQVLSSALNDSDTAAVMAAGNEFHARTTTVTLAFKLIDNTFPPIDKAMKLCKSVAVVARAEAMDAIKRASLFAQRDDRNSSSVLLEFDRDAVTIRAENSSRGRGVEEVACSYDGKPTTVQCEPRYLLDVLTVIPDDHTGIHVRTDLDPIGFSSQAGAEFAAVVMPQRQSGR